ncbi:CLUMA_CG006559, isoform A [Clunio marinus]|uniref:CLUMA_CG006559, isoform A n=1 Tax=Clunio marinus TaxID=568069 RepID=A0A1J1HY36_9DIPT|nr:CLUMA_CG006559, isoform A [Clunio marinus]
MVLTKQYLKYNYLSTFNIIASARSNGVLVDFNDIRGRYFASAAVENVIIWDLRTGDKIAELSNNNNEEVTYLEVFENKLAVGYQNGRVALFNLKTQSLECTLPLHRTAISYLKFDGTGTKLLSGGLDNDVVVTDTIDHIGKQRLCGHSAPITCCLFLEKYDGIVLSSSKDKQIKFWDIETQFCFKTIMDNDFEIWGMTLLRDDTYLVTGSKENALSVYKISEELNSSNDINNPTATIDAFCPIRCDLVGNIQRCGKGRTVNLKTDKENHILACSGTDSEIELFYFCSEKESITRLSKRLKKLSVTNPSDENNTKLSLTDEIKRIPSIKTKEKVKSFDMLLTSSNELRVCVTFANNLIMLYKILDITQKNPEVSLNRSISLQGHHTECRSVCFSSDNLAIASGSGDSLKIWNRSTLSCLRTVDTKYIISSCFAPGDRHILLGSKCGNLLIVDIVGGEVIETIPAHEKEVWSVSLLPDLRGCITGGGDNTVKFWSFELVNDTKNGNENQKVLSLIHKNTLQLEESVLGAKVTPDGKYVACALLDSTIKVFFMDTFKFFLSLYGHKLPVLCMDISYDSTLIATGSADRNVKIWGMDFGDCHRSLFAHDDSVMALQFIPKTHMFFTCGKDGKIKQWDADTFEKIITLPGHIGEAYSLCVSPNGKFLVTCGSDRTIRIFERTNEPLILQDEQEEEREEIENRTLATGENSLIPGLPGLNLPSKKTVGAEKAAENILDCLEQIKKLDNDSSNEIPLIMKFYEASNTIDYLVAVFGSIRTCDLEEALLLLPFSCVCEILEKLPVITSQRKDQTELICKIAVFLLKIHHKPIISNRVMLLSIKQLIQHLQESVAQFRDTIGENICSMGLLQQRIENKDKIELFKDSSKAQKIKDKKQKKRQIMKRVHMQISS